MAAILLLSLAVGAGPFLFLGHSRSPQNHWEMRRFSRATGTLKSLRFRMPWKNLRASASSCRIVCGQFSPPGSQALR